MATVDGSDVRYTLYDKISRCFINGWNFTNQEPYGQGYATFDQAYDIRRQIMSYHKNNYVKSDIVIIKVSKTWNEVEGNY